MAAEHCPNFPKSLILLHSEADDSTNQMFSLLEDAIIKKYGEEAATNLKNYLVSQNCLTDYGNHEKRSDPVSTSSLANDRKSSISEEIGIENFDEELICCICKGIFVGAGNILVECNKCHSLYHQECHNPVLTEAHVNDSWSCSPCQKKESQSFKKLNSSRK